MLTFDWLLSFSFTLADWLLVLGVGLAVVLIDFHVVDVSESSATRSQHVSQTRNSHGKSDREICPSN